MKENQFVKALKVLDYLVDLKISCTKQDITEGIGGKEKEVTDTLLFLIKNNYLKESKGKYSLTACDFNRRFRAMNNRFIRWQEEKLRRTLIYQ